MDPDKFSNRLLNWFDQHGRHGLPWQLDKTLYRVWVSEIMLQQTQVATVIPYYERFMASFPNLKALAKASIDEVLAHWAGLGYYARGRNLHKAAGIIATEHKGQFPADIESVIALPGIGRSTAGAILSLALNQRHTILDGNVKRSLCRYHGIETYPGERKTAEKLWQLAEQHTPHSRHGDYTQAIMDMGAVLCTRTKPVCTNCPHQTDCFAFKQSKVASIPRRKPKKVKPKKHLAMLVLINEQKQLTLFKRPSSGIWGGLYSLPEFESTQACLTMLRKCSAELAQNTHAGEDIQHSFSHYDLRISPLYCYPNATQQSWLNKELANIEEIGVLPAKQALYPISLNGQQAEIGLPTPIQKIVHQI